MNKALITILIYFILPVYGFGQNYKSFISESKQWRYVQTLYLLDCGVEYYVAKYYFKGDTIIDETKYNKLYSQQEQSSKGESWLAYFLREDTIQKKVYIYDFHFDTKALLYDFNLKKGDSFNRYILDNLYSEHKVANVDSVIIKNESHKRIIFDDSTKWIEGIGCVTRTIVPSDGELICVQEDSNVLYINSNYENCDTVFEQNDFCDAVVNVSHNLYDFLLYPNPITSLSQLVVKSDKHEKMNLEIYNSVGILVRKDSFIDIYPIGLSNLSPGLYFYRIMIGNNVIGFNKIVVK